MQVRPPITLVAVALLAACCTLAEGAERELLLGTSVLENVDAYVEAPQRLIALANQADLTTAERRARYAELVPETLSHVFISPLGVPELRVARFVHEEILATTTYRPDDQLLMRFVVATGTLMEAYDRLHAARTIDDDDWLTAEISLWTELTRFTAGIAAADRAALDAWDADEEIRKRATVSAGFPHPPTIAASARRVLDWRLARPPFTTVFAGWWRSADAQQRAQLSAACGTGPLAPLLATAIAQVP